MAFFTTQKESFISEMVDETEKKELERIKAKYQNNLGTDYSSFNYSLSHDYQSTAHTPTYSLILGDLWSHTRSLVTRERNFS